jgi:hypothetical protein
MSDIQNGLHTVAVPAYEPRRRCWAVTNIRRWKIGDLDLEICGRKPRKGRLTCDAHAQYEADAQALRKKRGIA